MEALYKRYVSLHVGVNNNLFFLPAEILDMMEKGEDVSGKGADVLEVVEKAAKVLEMTLVLLAGVLEAITITTN